MSKKAKKRTLTFKVKDSDTSFIGKQMGNGLWELKSQTKNGIKPFRVETNVLSVNGFLNANHLMALARRIFEYKKTLRNGGLRAKSKKKEEFSDVKILEFVKKNEARLQVAHKVASKLWNHSRIESITTYGLVLWISSELNIKTIYNQNTLVI